MVYSVYVPKENTCAMKLIAKGSAIVGQPRDDIGIMVYYEGNLYNAANINTFEDKAMIAAGRMQERYPTVAKMLCPNDELIHVGQFDLSTNTFSFIGTDKCKRAFDDWVKCEIS